MLNKLKSRSIIELCVYWDFIPTFNYINVLVFTISRISANFPPTLFRHHRFHSLIQLFHLEIELCWGQIWSVGLCVIWYRFRVRLSYDGSINNAEWMILNTHRIGISRRCVVVYELYSHYSGQIVSSNDDIERVSHRYVFAYEPSNSKPVESFFHILNKSEMRKLYTKNLLESVNNN